MNTSGPSSRPRKPYPFALLNHLTVPFRRSTFVLFPLRKMTIRKCVRIVLRGHGTVKDFNHIPMVGSLICTLRDIGIRSESDGTNWRTRDCTGREGESRSRRRSPRPARHFGIPQNSGDRLCVPDTSPQCHALCFRKRKESNCNPLVDFRLGDARLQSER